ISYDVRDISTVSALQLNDVEQDVVSSFLGSVRDIYHQYKILASLDGKEWQTIVDKSGNKSDVPHDYIELGEPVKARYIKLENVHVPSGKFAISGLRIFGKGAKTPPPAVNQFIVMRT